jgi:hypothetical protein
MATFIYYDLIIFYKTSKHFLKTIMIPNQTVLLLVIINFVIVLYIKVPKHILSPYCHLVAETGSGFLAAGV